MKKTLLCVILILTLTVSAVSPLLSCSFSFRTNKPATKEEISEKIEKDDGETFSKVTDYFKHWSLPSFYAQDFTYFETALKARFYPDDAATREVARAVADLFLEEDFEAVKDKTELTVTPRLLYRYFEVLSARDPGVSDETLLAATKTAPADFTYALQFLLAWGFPVFDGLKVRQAENTVRNYFYLRDELPTAYETAKTLALDYLAAEERPTALADVTDALLDDYISLLGDRYAYYRTPTEHEEYDTDMSGKFTGIGVSVEYDKAAETLTVIGVIDGTPAYEAGLKPGDVLIAVDGALVSDLGYDETINRVRGLIGTSVTVTVDRGGTSLDFTMIRAEIDDVTVSYTMEGDIAVVRITQFKFNTGDQFVEVIDKIEAEGAKAVVFDLRSNPGGYLSAVVQAISYLVPRGTEIVSFSNYYVNFPAEVASDDHVLSIPAVVLCNGYTASAGELFTAALRDYNEMGLIDATVVGETTYKKGIMQEERSLWDGSSVTLTVALYNPPSGVNYHGIGVVPDEEIVLSAQTDNQKARALEILDAKIHPVQ